MRYGGLPGRQDRAGGGAMRGWSIIIGSWLLAAGIAPAPAQQPPAAQAVSPRVAALEKLAAAGNAEALYHLGMAWHTGSGVPQDRAKALGYFRRAAELGDPLAAYKLGCYYDGQGEGLVAPDDAIAYYFKSIAAEAGYALAQTDAAELEMRRGDMASALGWLEQAAAQGWPAGLLGYASLHNLSADEGKGVPRDKAKTAAYFRLFTRAVDADQKQLDWLAAFEKTLNRKERRQAAAIVAGFHAEPSPITLKALSGSRAADALIGSQ